MGLIPLSFVFLKVNYNEVLLLVIKTKTLKNFKFSHINPAPKYFNCINASKSHDLFRIEALILFIHTNTSKLKEKFFELFKLF